MKHKCVFTFELEIPKNVIDCGQLTTLKDKFFQIIFTMNTQEFGLSQLLPALFKYQLVLRHTQVNVTQSYLQIAVGLYL